MIDHILNWPRKTTYRGWFFNCKRYYQYEFFTGYLTLIEAAFFDKLSDEQKANVLRREMNKWFLTLKRMSDQSDGDSE